MTTKHSSAVSAPLTQAHASHAPGFFARLWQAYVEAQSRRASIAALRAMDERSLKDIGITRGDIERAVYGRIENDLEIRH